MNVLKHCKYSFACPKMRDTKQFSNYFSKSLHPTVDLISVTVLESVPLDLVCLKVPEDVPVDLVGVDVLVLEDVPVDLVGVDVLVLEDVPTYGLQIHDVAVQGLAAHLVQLLQHLRLYVAGYLTTGRLL
jgi:hypothetical protein